MDGGELITQHDAATLERRVGAHVIEPAQAEEVRDGLANVGHRERPADLRLDDLHERRIGRLVSFEYEPHRGDTLAEVVGHGGVRGAAERRRQPPRDRAGGGAWHAHQNTFFTRNSSAND